MGINNLFKFLKTKTPNAFQTIPVSAFKGKRIAFDAGIFMCNLMSPANKIVLSKIDYTVAPPDHNMVSAEWKILALTSILKFISNGITPVFIFDGKSPIEKQGTKDKRHADRLKKQQTIEDLYSNINNNIGNRATNSSALYRALANNIVLTKDDIEIFKNLLADLAVPYMMAKAEAEQLCAMLCIEGKVAAIYTEDSDALAYGCPLTIRHYKKRSNTEFECVRFDEVLRNIGLSRSSFVDLCIMSGCDHNTNIPNKAIGRSYPLLVKHEYIEYLPKNLDITCLNHEFCRGEFKYIPSTELTISKSTDDLHINYEVFLSRVKNLSSFLDQSIIDKLTILICSLVHPEDGTIEGVNYVECYAPPTYI